MKEQNDIKHREYRAIGRFSADRVRELTPGPIDAIKLGCPAALFERVLEKRAAFRAGQPVSVLNPREPLPIGLMEAQIAYAKAHPLPTPLVSPAEREELRKQFAAQAADPLEAERRRAREMARIIEADAEADYARRVEAHRTHLGLN